MSDKTTESGFDTDIAVVGMAGRFAGARSIDEFWRNLRDGVESIRTYTDDELLAAGVDPALLKHPHYVKAGAPLPDMEMFDAGFFGFSPRDASIMDPQHRHFLECAWEALENAGHVPERFPGSIGVFAGSGHNAYLPYNLLSNPKLVSQVGFFLLRHTGNDKDFLTTRVSYLFDLKGPSVNVQTACSTSLVAIHTACQSLLNGECDMAIAGGVTIELPHRQGYLHKEGEVMSPDGHCRSFDAGSQGTSFGSGIGVVTLRRLADALADGDHIHAVVKGSAINNDGAGKVGYLAPSVDGQARAIAEALAMANVPADTISYVEAHGTGTPVGDPIEISALTQAWRQSTDRTGCCAIGSVKSNIGHTDTAAGVASFIKVALALQHRQLPPSLHFASPNPACHFETSPFYVNDTLQPWTAPPGTPRRAGVNSLGVGGTNAYVVLEEAPARVPSGPSRSHQLLVISAKTPTALDANTAAMAEHLCGDDAGALADVAYTLQVGRQAMKHRRIVVAEDAADAVAALRALDPQRVVTQACSDASRGVVFMFAGGGAQYPGMGADLYRSEPVFRAAVDECLELLARRAPGVDVRRVLFPLPGEQAGAAKQLERPSLALPALLTIQVAQARLWMSWGISPAAMIGHSMGEYTAAHLAGVFSLEDALALVELRGRLFETLPEGGMLSVPLSEVELRSIMGHDLSVAAVNGPRLTVASGPAPAIDALQRLLDDREVEASRVRISVAAHSLMLEPILQPFGDFFKRIAMKAPTLPFVSNLSGTWITPAEATDPAYWVRHLRSTVRFADGLNDLLRDDSRILLEVGPGRTLASLARQHPSRAPQQPVLNSMRHPDEQVCDVAFMLGVLGRLWANGAPVDWDRVKGDERRLRVALPTYRYDHQRHWVEPGQGVSMSQVHEPTLDKRTDIGDWFYQPVWKHKPRTAPVRESARTLVFADDCSLAARLVEALRADGADVSTVRPGSGFERRGDEFTIDPGLSADYDALFATLNGEGRAPQHIVHLWTVTGAGEDASGLEAAEDLQRLGFFSLLQLAQAIGREVISHPIRLAVVTDRLQRVAGESDLVPAKATVLGPCKVIPAELPNIACCNVDVVLPPAGSRQEALLVEHLRCELAAGDDAVVAYRANDRWVQAYEPMPLAARAEHTGLRPRGVYLITGGLGGVGLALAEYLAGALKARLVLVSRSGLPDRKEWVQRLGEGDDAQARRIRQVMALEALGAEVMVAAADVTDLAQMQAVVQRSRERFGTVHGVLHTAGVLDDGAIQLKSVASAQAVLAPKLRGTLVLEAVLQDTPLDFMVLFSSISAFTGLAGQVDYAAANAFLDAYAQARVARDGGCTVAVNWSQWQDVGMAAALAQQLGLAHKAYDEAQAVAVDHPLVERCLEDASGSRVYETRFDVARHWLLDEHRVRGGEALIPGTGYLEIVRAVFARSPEPRAMELRNVVFLAPFVVRAGQPRELRVHIHPAGPAPAHFSVVSPGGGDLPWVQNVRGTVQYVDVPPPHADMPQHIAARCTRRSHVCSEEERPLHMDFGPRWRNVERIDYGDGEALLTLALPEAYAGDLAQIELHPALLDMATAGAQALVPGFDEREDFFVPASYGVLRIHGPMTQRLWSHVRLRRDETGGKELAVYDVTVFDADGKVVTDIAEFTMIRVRDKALLAGAAAPAASHAPARQRATANHVLELGLNEGILSYEGAQVVERIVSAGAGPQVIVSPQDLTLLMTRLRESSQPSKEGVRADAQAGADGRRAPATATEQLIAQMWSELLGVERVSASDNFFDLGGHSLLAVQVINRLRKRTGKSLTLTALMEAPTVESLAALIEPPPAAAAEALGAQVEAAPRSGVLVPIRQGGAKMPIFFVHDGNGETLLYRTLALQLDPGHPVYGLQPQMRADASYVHTRITDMATAHIEQLRAVQPNGPYLLTGLCAGGVVSFEMARQLQDAGETTLFVGIIDAADVAAQERPFRLAQDRLHRFLGTLGQASQGPAFMRIGKALPSMVRKTVNYARYEVASRLEQSRNARKVQALREHESHDQAACEHDSGLSFLKMYEVAHREHEPRGLFSGGDVVVFRATQGDGSVGDVPYVDIYSDPALGWRERVAGEVHVVDIPGGHSSALQEPHVKELARTMQACIDAALSKVPPDDRGGGHHRKDGERAMLPATAAQQDDNKLVTARATLSWPRSA